jgi:uncharacterized Tic20 family protein
MFILLTALLFALIAWYVTRKLSPLFEQAGAGCISCQLSTTG